MILNTTFNINHILKDDDNFTQSLFRALEMLVQERVFFEHDNGKAWQLKGDNLNFLLVQMDVFWMVLRQRDDNWSMALKLLENGYMRPTYYDYVVCAFLNQDVCNIKKMMELLSTSELHLLTEKQAILFKGKIRMLSPAFGAVAELVQALHKKDYFPEHNIEQKICDQMTHLVKKIQGDEHFTRQLSYLFHFFEHQIAIKNHYVQAWREHQFIMINIKNYTYVICQKAEKSWDVALINPVSIVPSVQEMQMIFQDNLAHLVSDLSLRIEQGILTYFADSQESFHLDLEMVQQMIENFEPKMLCDMPQHLNQSNTVVYHLRKNI